MRDVIKAAYLEGYGLRRAVTTAVIALIAGAYSMAQPLGPWEKHLAVRFIWIVVAGGWYLLCSLQCHLRRTRLVIDPDDRYPLWRGADVVIGMVVVLMLSAGAISYSLLWRDPAHHLLLRMQGQVY